MSALPPKADIRVAVAVCLLRTRSGQIVNVRNRVSTRQLVSPPRRTVVLLVRVSLVWCAQLALL